jgi:glycosyltransferase involved in cell wall biosynthesis
MYRGLRVAVVIPAHNEEALLPVTLAGLPAFVDMAIVVDDASTDGTAQVADHAALDLVRHPVNQGVGGAIVTGYRRALTRGADVAVVVGADAQMDPAEMSALIDPIADGQADYVKGDRLGHPEVRQRMPAVRLFGNRVLSRMTRWSSGYAVRDSQCGYTALAADTLARLPLDDLYPRYGFPNDLLAKLAEIDARVVDRPVTPIYGDEQSGIRVTRVVGPIMWLLLRSGVRRVRRQRKARLALNAQRAPMP